MNHQWENDRCKNCGLHITKVYDLVKYCKKPKKKQSARKRWRKGLAQ